MKYTLFLIFVELAHFARYALGIYSTFMFLYMNPCCGMCKLCHFCSCVQPMGYCNPLTQCCEDKSNFSGPNRPDNCIRR